MDSKYMQMEKVRGMSGGMMPEGKPRSLEAPAQESLESMGYGDSAAKCDSCAHFDGANSMCSLAGEECDPGGHCAKHEPMEGGNEEMREPDGPEETE